MQTKKTKSAGSRIIESPREAVDWVEGKGVALRVTYVELGQGARGRDGEAPRGEA